MSKGGVTGPEMRAVVRREILLVTLAILLVGLLSLIVATYIYYPWPEILVIHSSLVALSSFIAVRARRKGSIIAQKFNYCNFAKSL